MRRHRKEAGGEDYEYWSLVKTVRAARGSRHQIVARLGKLDGAEVQAARDWEDLDVLLELDELRSMDVILPTRPAREIRLRVVARPEKAPTLRSLLLRFM